MKQLIKDIISFSKSLTAVDLLLYFAVLTLIILIVSLIYIIKTSDDEEAEDLIENKTTFFNQEDVDIKEIITNIENREETVSEFTDYESEQEEKAIISYEELLQKSKQGKLNYEEEKVVNNEVIVKKVSLDNVVNKEEKEETPKGSLFHYEKEEAFLKALQSLNELLN